TCFLKDSPGETGETDDLSANASFYTRICVQCFFLLEGHLFRHDIINWCTFWIVFQFFLHVLQYPATLICSGSSRNKSKSHTHFSFLHYFFLFSGNIFSIFFSDFFSSLFSIYFPTSQKTPTASNTTTVFIGFSANSMIDVPT